VHGAYAVMAPIIEDAIEADQWKRVHLDEQKGRLQSSTEAWRNWSTPFVGNFWMNLGLHPGLHPG
jgi:hypothetical protein